MFDLMNLEIPVVPQLSVLVVLAAQVNRVQGFGQRLVAQLTCPCKTKIIFLTLRIKFFTVGRHSFSLLKFGPIAELFLHGGIPVPSAACLRAETERSNFCFFFRSHRVFQRRCEWASRPEQWRDA